MFASNVSKHLPVLQRNKLIIWLDENLLFLDVPKVEMEHFAICTPDLGGMLWIIVSEFCGRPECPRVGPTFSTRLVMIGSRFGLLRKIRSRYKHFVSWTVLFRCNRLTPISFILCNSQIDQDMCTRIKHNLIQFIFSSHDQNHCCVYY